MKLGSALAALLLLTLGLLALNDSRASAEGRRSSGDSVSVLVTFREDFDGDGDTRDRRQEEADEDEFVEGRRGHVTHRYDITDAVAIEVDPDEVAALASDPHVERVEPDVPVRIADAELDSSWGVKKVGSESNHVAGFRGDGVKVGVIDTGINPTHVDLAANYDPSCSYDFVNGDSNPTDDNGHGTHVSGIIGALENNTGVIGMAPDVTICSYKVLAANGGGSYSAILAALSRAIADDVEIVNLSLGSGYPGSTVQNAFASAHAQGLTIVAAAGNASPCDGTMPPTDNEIYPAKFPNVIAVASTDSNDNRSCFSSVGPDVEIAAPGSGVVAPWIGSNTSYASASGTSMATPHVAGLLAVLFGCDSPYTNAQLAQIVNNTALDLDSPVVAGFPDGIDTWFGYGRIRAATAAASASCQSATPTATTSPTRTNTPASTSTTTPTPTNTPTQTPTATATAPGAPTVTFTPPPPTSTLPPTNTAVPPPTTATSTAAPPTATGTTTATATPTSTPGSGGGAMLFSLGSSAQLSGITFQNEDIVAWNGSSFSMFFDGSDVLSTQVLIDGFAVVGDDDVLLTFASPGAVGGIVYDDSDVLRFTASSLGSTTAGTWSMYFDGSDVGLTSDSEDVDALEMLPNGQLLVSTVGSFSVTGVAGVDKDVVRFTPTMLGTTTTGAWQMHFDGSDVGLGNDSEDIDGLAISSSGSFYLSTTSGFGVSGIAGQDEDVFVFIPTTLGATTSGTYVPLLFFDGSTFGLSQNDIVDIDLP